MIVHQSDWMKITAQTSEEVEIDITGIIGGSFWDEDKGKNNTADKMRQELKRIAEIKARKIIVNIDSLGGLVNHGLSIYQLLSESKAVIETRVVGMTASIATIIAQAAKPGNRKMSDAALMLIHEARSIAMGTAEAMKSEYDSLEKINAKLADIYAGKSDKDQEYYRSLMAESQGEGRWIDSTEALEMGLIDSEIVVTRAAAVWGDDIFNQLQIQKPKQMTKPSKSLSGFFAGLVDFFAGYKADNPEVEIPQAITEQMEGFSAKVTEVENRNQELETQLTASATEVETLQAQVAEGQTALGTLRDEAAAQLAEVERLTNEAHTLRAEVERLSVDPLKIKGSDPKEGEPTPHSFDAVAMAFKNETGEIRIEGPDDEE